MVDVDDVRRLAARRLPRIVFDYVDGGAERETTLRANRTAFDALSFRPRAATRTAHRNLATTVLGMPLAMPVILGPCGYIRMVHHEGEMAAARAAAAAGTVFVMTTMAGYTLEEVAAATPVSKWFQLYFIGGRSAAEILVDRAAHAGYTAIVVTVDTPISGRRDRDTRNGVNHPIQVTMRNAARLTPQLLTKPRWLRAFLRDGLRLDVPNLVGLAPGSMTVSAALEALEWGSPTWDDIAWLRARWDGPMVVKGIMRGDDARRAADVGADAVIVSNHGGRQLDGTPASVEQLPEVVASLDGRVEVLVDGGVYSGADVVRALALGARSVLIGRAWVYGLATGQPGIARVLDILRTDIDRTLALLGCDDVRALDRSYLGKRDAEPQWGPQATTEEVTR